MASIFAGLLAGLAGIYGLGGVALLAFRSARLAFAREWKLALISIVCAASLAGIGIALGRLPDSDFPPPSHIPLYAGYIALCHYLINVLPKAWPR